MKRKTSPDSDDLRPDYGLELFSHMKRNRFAGAELQFKSRRSVYLDEGVAEVFDTPEAVTSSKTARAKRHAS